jgi:hypothetical protein
MLAVCTIVCYKLNMFKWPHIQFSDPPVLPIRSIFLNVTHIKA